MNPATINGFGNNMPPQVNGQTNGGAAPIKRIVRRKATASPFGTARQPGKPRIGESLKPAPAPQPSKLLPKPTTQLVAAEDSVQASGFNDPAVKAGSKPYMDFKLVATKKELIDGLKYHIMNLPHGKGKTVDIRDPKQFPLPAHLHRRDPLVRPVQPEQQAKIEDGMNDEERQAMKDRTELRKAERAANLALIAPTQATKRATGGKPKTKAVYKRDFTEEEKRRMQTNYEEKLPWHLEDFDNKYCFVSTNQNTSARRFVALAQETVTDSKTPKFRLVPVEKVYDFEPKRQVMTQEEADAKEKEKKAPAANPDWLEDKILRQKKERQDERVKQLKSEVYTGANRNNKFAGRTGEDVDLDYDDDDLFADDEEGDMYNVKDEDEAAAEKRIREDQLTANYFDVKEEEEYDQAQEESEKEEKMRKELGREYRRGLGKHERQFQYVDDDSDTDSSSEDEDELKEREAEEERRKKENESLKVDGAKAISGSGANTPRKGDLSDREISKSKNKLKRTGSPNLSDAGSGTDTSRAKKPKINHTSVAGGSRPGSPAGTKLKVRVGASSDTEAGALSDSQAKRLKPIHKVSGVPSRTASPAPGARSPAGSPPPSSATKMPTLKEVENVVSSYPDGITIKDLVARFKLGSQSKELIELIKPIVRTAKDKDGKLRLYLKDGLQQAA